MSLICAEWRIMPAGRGKLCDVTGALFLFAPICGGGAFTELYPLFLSVSLHVVGFPPCSATAGSKRPLTALVLHLLTGPEVVWELTLRTFFSPSISDICFMDRSVGWPAGLFVNLTDAAVHLEEVNVDFNLLESVLLQDG